MEIIIKLLTTLLGVFMCGLFIKEIIECYRKHSYGYIIIGIILIMYYICACIKVWTTF